MTKYRIIEHRCSDGISTFRVQCRELYSSWWLLGWVNISGVSMYLSLAEARNRVASRLAQDAVICESIIHEP